MLRPPRGSTLFPYTTLFRSGGGGGGASGGGGGGVCRNGNPFSSRRTSGRRDRRSPAPSGAPGGGALRIFSDRKSTRLNSSHRCISYAVFCLKKKKPLTPHIT